MSHSITQTKVNFSGKVALFSLFLMAAMITGQAQAKDFSPSEKAAVSQHFEILANQQAQSDDAMIEHQQQNFEAGLESAEDQFMHNICDEHNRQYDDATEVCYEK